MNTWALALAILKSKNKINYFIFRVHGFDLYKERWIHHYIPFGNTCHKYADKIFTVSQAGLIYFRLNNKFIKNVSYSYLGSQDNGFNPLPNGKTITLVSCSNIIPIKRLHLVIEILSKVNKNILWLHFGEGYSKGDILKKTSTLSSNIKIKFYGQVSQSFLINFYKTTPIDLFLNVSITEGLPFSIIEAISFGIPVIATDAGGTSEIVNAHTGLLLPLNFDINLVSTFINDFENTEFRSYKYRSGIKKFWKNNFSDNVVYPKFIDCILN